MKDCPSAVGCHKHAICPCSTRHGNTVLPFVMTYGDGGRTSVGDPESYGPPVGLGASAEIRTITPSNPDTDAQTRTVPEQV